jgi:hypothetical protein
LQVDGGTFEVPWQTASPQVAMLVGKTHAAVRVPLHEPPHTLPSVAHAARVPCGSPVAGEQVPSLPGTSHAAHCSVQDVLQQKPSTQEPEVQSLDASH